MGERDHQAMTTNRLVIMVTVLAFFLLVCMPWLARADLSSTDWPFTFPGLCRQSHDGRAQEFFFTLTEYRVHGEHEYRYTWERWTNCQTVSPISPVEVVMVPEPGPAVSLITGALGVYTLRRMRS